MIHPKYQIPFVSERIAFESGLFFGRCQFWAISVMSLCLPTLLTNTTEKYRGNTFFLFVDPD